MTKRVAMSEKPDVVHNDQHGHDLAPSGTRMTDKDNSSSRYADSEAGVAHKSGLAKAERRLLLKLGESVLTSIADSRCGYHAICGTLVPVCLPGQREFGEWCVSRSTRALS
jgi:hypothetical protein